MNQTAPNWITLNQNTLSQTKARITKCLVTSVPLWNITQRNNISGQFIDPIIKC
jgi:hypothetical protein